MGLYKLCGRSLANLVSILVNIKSTQSNRTSKFDTIYSYLSLASRGVEGCYAFHLICTFCMGVTYKRYIIPTLTENYRGL